LVDEVSARFNPSIAVDTLESEKWTMASENVLQLHRSAGGSDDPRTLQWPEARSNDAMIASLIGSEGILGLLYVARNRFRQPFSDKEGLLLRAFADHISMPLQKAKYQETLSLLAFKDEMTGLSNFRYFERRLSEDLIRAKRYKQTLTLIIMDIDHFKKFNDVYGHKAGNVLLKQFGQLLKDCLRESDLPARYGGEEFIAICPAISGLEALIVAERIRTTFEQARFDLGESLTGAPVNVKITVSVGCATYPDHGLSPNHLVRQADRALYAAKNRGRNIVVSCDELSESDNPSPEKSPSER
jgi:diguanylate cyclase (GGDEF)-like protein